MPRASGERRAKEDNVKGERKPMTNLKIMRIKREMSQTRLAKKVGISQSSLSCYEDGVISPRVDVLFKLAEVLDCDIKDIV